MKNGKPNHCFGLFFALVTFFALNLAICAQGVKIKQEEFAAAHQKAFERVDGKPRRIMFKSIVRFERAISISENVTEIIPPDKSRFYSIYTSEPKNSSAEFTSEIIEIGSKRFTRKDNGAWTESEPLPKPENKSRSEKHETAKNVEYYFLGETTFDGQPAISYRVVVHDKIKPRQPTGTNPENLVVIKTKYWFGKNGLWIRDESEYEFIDPATNKVTHTQQMTRTYDYAPNLKIEAPQMN